MTKKFVASYSGGKDSMLAIYKAIAQGLMPLALIITYNIDKKYSWFHNIPKNILDDVSKALEIPIWIVNTDAQQYAYNFEETLKKAKKLGAQVCVFGDIDIEEHRKWCTERCQKVGIEALLPLWGKSREELVCEFINKKFISNITIVDKNRMSNKFLGQILTLDLVNQLKKEGIDVCGENGEYHTFVSDGPLFKYPIKFSFEDKILQDKYEILPIK